LRLTGTALFMTGPFSHYRYQILEKFAPGRTWRPVLSKLFIDNTLIAPIVVTAYLAVTNLLAGLSNTQVARKVRVEFWSVYGNGALVWPLAGLINFKFIPIKYNVLWFTSISLCWNTYLSTVTNRGLPEIGTFADPVPKIEDNAKV